jgi:hypothetical protein
MPDVRVLCLEKKFPVAGGKTNNNVRARGARVNYSQF